MCCCWALGLCCLVSLLGYVPLPFYTTLESSGYSAPCPSWTKRGLSHRHAGLAPETSNPKKFPLILQILRSRLVLNKIRYIVRKHSTQHASLILQLMFSSMKLILRASNPGHKLQGPVQRAAGRLLRCSWRKATGRSPTASTRPRRVPHRF